MPPCSIAPARPPPLARGPRRGRREGPTRNAETPPRHAPALAAPRPATRRARPVRRPWPPSPTASTAAGDSTGMMVDDRPRRRASPAIGVGRPDGRYQHARPAIGDRRAARCRSSWPTPTPTRGQPRSSDLILGADGKAESVAAKFGGFLGFGGSDRPAASTSTLDDSGQSPCATTPARPESAPAPPALPEA